MAITRYQPFSTRPDFNREIARLFDLGWGREADAASVGSDWLPAVDIVEEDARFVLYADLPGIRPEEVEITFENGVLSLSGSRPALEENAQANYHRVERSRGTFLRRFTLPDTVDGEGIQAHASNGVLEVIIPKGAKAQPRRIQITQ